MDRLELMRFESNFQFLADIRLIFNTNSGMEQSYIKGTIVLKKVAYFKEKIINYSLKMIS